MITNTTGNDGLSDASWAPRKDTRALMVRLECAEKFDRDYGEYMSADLLKDAIDRIRELESA